MNDKIKDGGPDFPFDHVKNNCLNLSDGMTLRDYFAAKAMAARLVNCTHPDMDKIATRAYLQADAMILERDKCR